MGKGTSREPPSSRHIVTNDTECEIKFEPIIETFDITTHIPFPSDVKFGSIKRKETFHTFFYTKTDVKFEYCFSVRDAHRKKTKTEYEQFSNTDDIIILKRQEKREYISPKEFMELQEMYYNITLKRNRTEFYAHTREGHELQICQDYCTIKHYPNHVLRQIEVEYKNKNMDVSTIVRVLTEIGEIILSSEMVKPNTITKYGWCEQFL